MLASAACSAAPGNSSSLGQSPAGLEQVPLTITSKGKVHRFVVEVAVTPQDQQYGLMNRQELAADHGMIFPQDQPRTASFWMKNTFIPLDLIFVRTDGTIANIAENAVPMSLDFILSDGEVGAVLEINGGKSAELGIAPGDRVEWPK